MTNANTGVPRHEARTARLSDRHIATVRKMVHSIGQERTGKRLGVSPITLDLVLGSGMLRPRIAKRIGAAIDALDDVPMTPTSPRRGEG